MWRSLLRISIFFCIGLLSYKSENTKAQKCKKDPMEKRLFNRKRIHSDYLKNIRTGDIIAMDTVVIRYKKKDTTFKVFKYKGAIPLLTSHIGTVTLSDSVPYQTMQEIIDSPIRISDKNHSAYHVVSYRFSYKKKDVYLDDETMSIKIKYDFISYYVHENPLPKKRVKNIKNEIKDGEEFWFEKIIVANDKNEHFFSPDIHITTY